MMRESFSLLLSWCCSDSVRIYDKVCRKKLMAKVTIVVSKVMPMTPKFVSSLAAASSFSFFILERIKAFSRSEPTNSPNPNNRKTVRTMYDIMTRFLLSTRVTFKFSHLISVGSFASVTLNLVPFSL